MQNDTGDNKNNNGIRVGQRLRYTIPNSFTAISLLLGVASIFTGQLGNLELAGWMIVWCGLLDVMDGLTAEKRPRLRWQGVQRLFCSSI